MHTAATHQSFQAMFCLWCFNKGAKYITVPFSNFTSACPGQHNGSQPLQAPQSHGLKHPNSIQMAKVEGGTRSFPPAKIHLLCIMFQLDRIKTAVAKAGFQPRRWRTVVGGRSIEMHGIGVYFLNRHLSHHGYNSGGADTRAIRNKRSKVNESTTSCHIALTGLFWRGQIAWLPSQGYHHVPYDIVMPSKKKKECSYTKLHSLLRHLAKSCRFMGAILVIQRDKVRAYCTDHI